MTGRVKANEHVEIRSDDAGTEAIINEPRYNLRRSVREGCDVRKTYRDIYKTEFHYMQQSVKEIRNEVKEKNQTQLNIKDVFRHIVNIVMNQVFYDEEYAQMKYKKGIKVHGKLAIEAILK